MRNLYKVILTFCLLVFHPLVAEEYEEIFEECNCCCQPPDYLLIMDHYGSMTVGSELFATTLRGYQKLDDQYLQPYFSTPGFWGGTARFLKLVALDEPFACLTMVFQHEFFGHGARGRQLDIPLGYEINAPFPYGPGGGATWFGRRALESKGLLQQQTCDTGGVEANELLGRNLVLKSMTCGQWDYRTGLLYNASYHDLRRYIYSIRDIDEASAGNDMAAYVNGLNTLYGKNVMTYSKLRSAGLINYLDPLYYVSIWADLRYIYAAELAQRIPMIRIGCVGFLPGMRLALAPYGLEYGLNSYLDLNGMPAFAYVRYGSTQGHNSYALGFEAPAIWQCDELTFGGKTDLWLQPVSGRSMNRVSSTTPGARLAVNMTYQFSQSFAWYAEISAKTAGFVIGEPVASNVTVRVGVALLDF